MAKTLLQLQTSLAYRMGEDQVPNSASEVARRKNFLNEGYNDIMRRHYWWFTESTGSFDSVALQESYSTADGIPDDIRSILELRFQGKLYNPITQSEGMGSMSTPYSNFSQSYFMFGGSIYFVPPLASAVTDGVTLKYYKTHTPLSADADVTLIPDNFVDALVSFAYARTNVVEGERGSASDGFSEYNEAVRILNEEQNKYLFSFKSSSSELQAEYP